MGDQWTLQFLCTWGAQPSLQSALPSLEGDSDIQCVLQDCGSPESNGSLEPKRPGGSEAASGSQEKLDFNRNLKEGKKSALVRDRDLGRGVFRRVFLIPLVSSSRTSHREAAVQ